MRKTWSVLWVLCLGLLAAGKGRADDRSAALDLVDKAIRAHGGEAALLKSQRMTRRVSGTMSVPGADVPFSADTIFDLPTRYRASIEMVMPNQKLQLILALKEERGWRSNSGMLGDLPKEETEELQNEAYVLWLLTLVPLKGQGMNLELLPDLALNGQVAAGIKASRDGKPDVRLYFDKRSNLLTRVEHKAREAGLTINKDHLFSEYKSIDGVLLPSREVQFSSGKKLVDVSLKGARCLPKVDDSLFVKP